MTSKAPPTEDSSVDADIEKGPELISVKHDLDISCFLELLKDSAPKDMIKIYAKKARGEDFMIPRWCTPVTRPVLVETAERIFGCMDPVNRESMNRLIAGPGSESVEQLRRNVASFMNTYMPPSVITDLTRRFFDCPLSYIKMDSISVHNVEVSECVTTRVRWMSLPEITLRYYGEIYLDDENGDCLPPEELGDPQFDGKFHFNSFLQNLETYVSNFPTTLLPFVVFYISELVHMVSLPELGSPISIMKDTPSLSYTIVEEE